MGFIVWFFMLQCPALIFRIALVVSSGLWDFLRRGLEMFYMLLYMVITLFIKSSKLITLYIPIKHKQTQWDTLYAH